MLSNSILMLRSSDLIASGSERDCYFFPKNEDLCVKVTHARDRDKSQSQSDYKYYARLSKKLIDWSRVARCHGWVVTNKGDGLVFDLVKDVDGTPSMMLDKYLKLHGTNDEVMKELKELRQYLIINNIMVCDLRDRNIACQAGRDGLCLKLIDGVGNRDFIKLCDWWGFLGKRKINRHWKKLEKRARIYD